MAKSTGAETRPAVDTTTDEWTEGELAEVRAELAAEAEQLREQVAAEEAVINGLGAKDDGGDDLADAGAATQDREHEMSLAANGRSMLQQAERAIARLDAGTYGVCEGCGGPIPKGRLLARPKVTLCVTCQQREDRR